MSDAAGEVRSLVPRHKSDGERVRALIEAGYPVVAPILPELLEWLQDLNWPIAQPLGEFLATIGEPLAPEIRRVFATDDVIWKYCVVQELVVPCPALASALALELEEYAGMEARDDDDEYLRDVSRKALEALRGERMRSGE